MKVKASQAKPSQAKPNQAAHELPKGSTTKAAHYFVLVQFCFLSTDGRIFFIQKMWRKMNLLTSSMMRYREGKFIAHTSTFGLKFSSLLLLLMTMRPKRVSKNNMVKSFRTSYCASHSIYGSTYTRIVIRVLTIHRMYHPSYVHSTL